MTYEEIKKRVDEKAPHASEGFRRAIALITHVPPQPCPFCGGDATLYYHAGREPGHEGFATICCNTENCRGNTPMAVPPVGDIERELARWNRRAHASHEDERNLPDCQDPFTERVKEIYRTRERFAHLDRVLRECATSDDPVYRTAAALWEAISGPANK